MSEARDLASRRWTPTGQFVTVRSRSGKKWRMHDPGGRMARPMRRGEPYEQQLLETIYEQTEPGGVALDVGAHSGNHTLFMAIACGLEVHAFEPLTYNLQRLRANLGLNSIGPDKVTVWPYAAGDRTGHARWLPGRYLSLEMTEQPDDEAVRVVRVDDCLPDLTGVSVVKLDVEEFEPQALAGMTGLLRRNEPSVWAEAHTEEALRAQEAVLGPLGYGLARVMKLGSKMSQWKMAKWRT